MRHRARLRLKRGPAGAIPAIAALVGGAALALLASKSASVPNAPAPSTSPSAPSTSSSAPSISTGMGGMGSTVGKVSSYVRGGISTIGQSMRGDL